MTFHSRPRHPGSPERATRRRGVRASGRNLVPGTVWALCSLHVDRLCGVAETETTSLGYRLVMVAGPMTCRAVAPCRAGGIRCRSGPRRSVRLPSRPEHEPVNGFSWLPSRWPPMYSPFIRSRPSPNPWWKGAQGTPPEPAQATYRDPSYSWFASALPVTDRDFLTLVSGCAGALVGHVTRGWRPRKRDVAHWFACLALVASFLVPLLIALRASYLNQRCLGRMDHPGSAGTCRAS